MTTDSLLPRALGNLLGDVIDGGGPVAAWVLNPGDPGLLAVLEGLSAATASRRPASGSHTIAGHASHLRYHFELLNRWADGEANPFATADWNGSWRTQTVTEPGWRQLLAELRSRAHAWLAAAQQPRTWEEVTLTGAMASAAHVTYHFGAIRQLIAAHQAADTPPR